ncbi:MAG: TetR/AcrR family transcriptional regulator [Pseudomonadota bacterium]
MAQSDVRRKPRQKRSKEKVGKILDVVEKLAIEQGLEGLTTTNIAETTGFAVGTIYQYFSNRTELLIAAEERMFERLAERLTQEVMTVLSNPVEDPIDLILGSYVENARSEPGYLPLLKFSVLNKPPGVNEATVQDFTGEIIETYLRATHPGISDCQAKITVKTLVSILAVLTDLVLLEPDPELQKRYQEEMIAQCKFAISRAAEPDLPSHGS